MKCKVWKKIRTPKSSRAVPYLYYRRVKIQNKTTPLPPKKQPLPTLYKRPPFIYISNLMQPIIAQFGYVTDFFLKLIARFMDIFCPHQAIFCQVYLLNKSAIFCL